MVAYERLTESRVRMEWLLAKSRTISNLPAFLILKVCAEEAQIGRNMGYFWRNWWKLFKFFYFKDSKFKFSSCFRLFQVKDGKNFSSNRPWVFDRHSQPVNFYFLRLNWSLYNLKEKFSMKLFLKIDFYIDWSSFNSNKLILFYTWKLIYSSDAYAVCNLIYIQFGFL